MFANDPKFKKAYEVMTSADNNNFNFEELMKNMEKEGPTASKDDSKMEEEPSVHKPAAHQPQPEAPKKPQELDEAEKAKTEGNNEYKQKNFPKAIELYQKAIDLKPGEPLYYNNKAAAFLELGEFAKAH
jgi:Flp pilus assembly protein TadD